jgi:hypothetical protein
LRNRVQDRTAVGPTSPLGEPLVITARCFYLEFPTKTTRGGLPVARRSCDSLEPEFFLSGVRSLMSQEMRRISAVFFTRRPLSHPLNRKENVRRSILPNAPPSPSPNRYKTRQSLRHRGKNRGMKPTPIGDPPGEADQPIRVKRGRPGPIVHGVNGKENSRHREMFFNCGRAETSSTGTREKM